MAEYNSWVSSEQKPPPAEAEDPDVFYPLQHALQDLALVFALSSVVFVLTVVTGLSETLLSWAEAYPRLRISEIFLYAIFIAVGFGIASLRRWMQLTRVAAEAKSAKRELQRKADALERSNQELERFAYAASHDMREPLRMVHSYLSMLEREATDGELNENARTWLDEARKASQRMDRMIRAILDYARLDPNGGVSEPTDADAALDDAVDSLELRFDEQDVTLHREPLPRVMAERTEIATVLLNLLQNALVHGGPDLTEIRVEAAQDGDHAIIQVKDDGTGVDPRHHARVFEMFHQGAGSSTSAGAGMGLALARRVIERHDGRLYHDGTRAPGACFVIELPVADPEQATDATASARSTASA